MVEDHKCDRADCTPQNLTTTNTTSSSSSTTSAPKTSSASSLIDDYHLPLENNNQTYATEATILRSSSNQTDTDKTRRDFIETIFLKTKNTFHLPLIKQEKFQWDAVEQGHIIGAFFYGYIIFQVPGARMAESVGAKWIIMAASAGSAVISLAFPLATQLNSVHLLMVLRCVLGLCQSAFFPAAYVLFCRWLPENERSVLLPIMFIGGTVGSVSTYIMSSYLITSSGGWPSVFYLSGSICTLCSLLWLIFGSNEPANNWLITDEELSYIECNVNSQTSESNSLSEEEQNTNQISFSGVTANEKNCKSALTVVMDTGRKHAEQEHLSSSQTTKNNPNGLKSACCGGDENASKDAGEPNAATTMLALPSNATSTDGNICSKREKIAEPPLSWTKLVTSVPVWTLILSMYGNEWSHAVLCYELPSYLNTALAYPIEQNGVINSFFQLTFAVASPIMSSLGAYMLDRHLFGMRKIHVRKLFQSLATFGQFVCFLSVPICGANRGLIITVMFTAILFKACANAGDIMVSGDLSPEYAGTIYACANSIGNTAGFGVPLLAGIVVGDMNHHREQWTPFWLITAAIMCASGLIFVIFGETRRQDFARREKDTDLELAKADGTIFCGSVITESSTTKGLNDSEQSKV